MFLYFAVGYHAEKHGLRSFVPHTCPPRHKTREPLLFARALQVETPAFFFPRAVHDTLQAGESGVRSREDFNTCVEAKGVLL
jgi:hypothetical protein